MHERRKRRYLKAQLEAGRSRSDGYIHIPKTGGSGIGEFFTKIAEAKADGRIPVSFRHVWTARDIVDALPGITLHFVIRDPVERIISGFLSRMRMGRPRNSNMWRPPEAISFLYFPTPEAFLRGLIADDERTRSAALFAARAISHVRRGYAHYFESVSYLEAIRSNLGIVREIDRLDLFLDELCRRCEIDPGTIESMYEKAHVSSLSAAGIKASLPADEIASIEAALAEEYAIYRYLQAYCASDRDGATARIR